MFRRMFVVVALMANVPPALSVTAREADVLIECRKVRLEARNALTLKKIFANKETSEDIKYLMTKNLSPTMIDLLNTDALPGETYEAFADRAESACFASFGMSDFGCDYIKSCR